MNDLDKLFKNKLLDREFEFKDSYWQAAEQLIEQEERKRKRGGLWWRLGVFLLLFAIAGYFVTNVPVTATVSASAEIEEAQNDVLKKEQNLLTQEILSNDINTNKENQTTNAAPIIPEAINPALINKQQSNTTSIQQPVLSYEKNTSKNDTSNKGVSLKNVGALEINKPNAQLPVADTVAQQPVEKAKQKLEIADKAVNEEEIFSNNELLTTDALAALEIKPAELDIPEADCDGCFELVKLKYKPKRFAFGLATEGLYFHKGSLGKSWYGTSLGGLVQYQFNRKIALRSGLQIGAIQYIDQKQDITAVRYGAQLVVEGESQYSFGLRTVNSFYNPKRIYQLEIPLVVQFRYKRHAIETGVQLSMLLGVKGSLYTESSLFPWEQDILETTANVFLTESVSNKWLPDQYFKNYTTNVMLGYEYSVSPRLAVHLSSYFSLESNPPPLQGRNGSFNPFLPLILAGSSLPGDNRKFHFRAGVKWFIKN